MLQVNLPNLAAATGSGTVVKPKEERVKTAVGACVTTQACSCCVASFRRHAVILVRSSVTVEVPPFNRMCLGPFVCRRCASAQMHCMTLTYTRGTCSSLPAGKEMGARRKKDSGAIDVEATTVSSSGSSSATPVAPAVASNGSAQAQGGGSRGKGDKFRARKAREASAKAAETAASTEKDGSA